MSNDIARPPTIAVLVLNWNGGTRVVDCVRSVHSGSQLPDLVLLVDNYSSDGSVQEIEGSFPQVMILKSPENIGFAAGNNLGLKHILEEAHFEWVLILSHDTALQSECIRALRAATAGANDRIGIMAPKMLMMDRPNILNSAGHIVSKWHGKIVDRGFGLPDNEQAGYPPACIGACGGAALYRSAMLREIGLFDESFVMYYEDAELSWRAFRRGWGARYVPGAVVLHKHQDSVKSTEGRTNSLRRVAVNTTRTVLRHGSTRDVLVYSTRSIFTFIGLVVKEARNRRRGSPPVPLSTFASFALPILKGKNWTYPPIRDRNGGLR